MSLNPSNAIAEITNPGCRTFPNLAIRIPDKERHMTRYALDEEYHKEWDLSMTKIDIQVKSELTEAGIECQTADFLRDCNGEVPSKHVGRMCMWGFHRAWYYWVAKGPGIPPEKAWELHKEFGTQCRVGGDCTCPSPDYYHGFAVGSYHIDTQEGLNAFAKLLKSIYKEVV